MYTLMKLGQSTSKTFPALFNPFYWVWMYLHKTLSRGINLFNMLTISISEYVYLTYTNFVNLYFFETLQNLQKKIIKKYVTGSENL